MCPTNCLCARFRETEVLHLAFLNETLHSTRNIFDGNTQVDPMLVEQIDGIDRETLERFFCNLFDVVRSAVQSTPLATVAGVGSPPEFRRDDDFAAKRREGFADKFFVQQRAIDLGGIEECNTPFHGGVQKSNHLLFIFWRSVGPAHSHISKSYGRYVQIPNSKFARLHRDYSQNPLCFFRR